jgi:hypothetical protein
VSRKLIGGELNGLLESLGVDPNKVRRIVLDLAVGEVPVAYVEMAGDAREINLEGVYANGLRPFVVCSSETAPDDT